MQKKNKKILFLIDIKRRDLPSSALIAYFLIKMKYEVYFQSISSPQKNFGYSKKRFEAIIFPKFNLHSDIFHYSFLQAKKNNSLIICIESEGNQNYTNIKKYKFHPDIYFFWGKNQKKKYYFKRNIKKVLGSPRMDFFHKKFEKLSSKKNIKKQLGINLNSKVITFMTRTQEAHKKLETIKKVNIRRKKMYIEPKNLFIDYFRDTKKILSINEKLIKKISKDFKDFKIIIKPHPNENIIFWEKKFSKNKNISVVKDMYSHDLLRISNFNITNNLCNTTLESQILGIPCLEIQKKFSQKFSIKDHYNLPDFTANSQQHAYKIFVKEIKKKNLKYHKKKVPVKIKRYIKKYFYKHDGLRSFDYAKNIDKYINNYSQKKRFSNNDEKMLKKLENKLDFFKNEKLSKFKNFLKLLIKSNYDIRGRYDHRYNKGDEFFWYKNFKKIGL